MNKETEVRKYNRYEGLLFHSVQIRDDSVSNWAISLLRDSLTQTIELLS